MREAVSTVLELRAPSPAGLSRLVKWSFGVHLGVAAGVIAWQAVMTHFTRDETVMTISLSGASGPATGGLTALGGRQVDEAAPAPKRPEPIPAVASKPNEMTIPTKSTTKPPPKPQTSAPVSSVITPPSTGRQVATGSSVVETGTRGFGAGLAQGGGAAQQPRVDLKFQFCCSEYLGAMQAEITKQVDWKQDIHGTTIIKFEVLSNGAIPIASVQVDKTSGNQQLDIEAQRAVRAARLPPLPAAYTGTSLTVYVTIPF